MHFKLSGPDYFLVQAIFHNWRRAKPFDDTHKVKRFLGTEPVLQKIHEGCNTLEEEITTFICYNETKVTRALNSRTTKSNMNNKVTGINTHLPIIIQNINGLNSQSQDLQTCSWVQPRIHLLPASLFLVNTEHCLRGEKRLEKESPTGPSCSLMFSPPSSTLPPLIYPGDLIYFPSAGWSMWPS